jgi:hypothetical protein
MNKNKYFIIAIALLIQSISALQAQNTEGTEFWLTFGANGHVTFNQVDLQIHIVCGSEPTTGTIYFTYLGNSIPFSIAANEVFKYPLISEKHAVYNTTTGVSDRSIRITSEKKISVYTLNQTNGSADATNIFPIAALGDNYYHISYTPLQYYEWIYHDAYAVIATKDNTQLFHDNSWVTTLNAGQVYYRTSLTDMTGSQITTDKPVAFFALNQCVFLPEGYWAADHLMQQLAPIKSWGRNFFVPVSHLAKDRVRIMVSQNGTYITQIGGELKSSTGSQMTLNNLQEGQFVELEVTLSNNGCFIVSNNPIGVCTYLTGGQYAENYDSDPSQSWLPALEQMVSKTTIAPFVPTGSSRIKDHYALIITATDSKDDTRVSVGGSLPVALSGGNWFHHNTAGMSFYNIPLTNTTTSYCFTNNAGLIVMCYGVGNAESYYYLAGSAMLDLDAAFYANDIHFQDLPDTLFCPNVVNFRAEIDGNGLNIDIIKWFINEVEEFSAQNQLTWSKHFSSGEYEIEMLVRFENNDSISKKSTIKIISCNSEAVFYVNDIHYQELINITFCENKVYFHAEIEGLHEDEGSLIWYINGDPQPAGQDQTTWERTLLNRKYILELDILFANDETVTLTGEFTIYNSGLKIRNVRRE